jgi:UDPglucose--hexose-1-phosphate uridylyltransferase
VPRRHLAGYEHVTAAERRDFARALRGALQRIRMLLADASVGFVLHSAPFGEGDTPYFHWHLEITPAVAVPELLADGSGFPVNPVPPEDAAQLLRAAIP